MTIIFSNAMDRDCAIIPTMWSGLNPERMVEIRPGMHDWEDEVDSAISSEDEVLILVGHGTERGLLSPTLNGTYVVHQNNVRRIKSKKVVCCWCYAAEFCHSYNLHAFATSMFISNTREAIDNSIYGYSQELIDSTAMRFYQEINHLLKNNVALEELVMRLGAHMDIENAVDTFNRQGICYIENVETETSERVNFNEKATNDAELADNFK